MVRLRHGLDRRQVSLEADGDDRGEGRARGHAGVMPMTTPAAGESPAADGEAGTYSRTTDITAGPGGVMTNEVGVITGDLTLRTEYADGQVTLRVQYKDADEWYAVTGARVPLAHPAALDAVHTVAMALLHRPEG